MKDKFIKNLLVIIAIELGGIFAFLVVIANKAEEISTHTLMIELDNQNRTTRELQKEQEEKEEAKKHPIRELFK